jgi:protein TonB
MKTKLSLMLSAVHAPGCFVLASLALHVPLLHGFAAMIRGEKAPVPRSVDVDMDFSEVSVLSLPEHLQYRSRMDAAEMAVRAATPEDEPAYGLPPAVPEKKVAKTPPPPKAPPSEPDYEYENETASLADLSQAAAPPSPAPAPPPAKEKEPALALATKPEIPPVPAAAAVPKTADVTETELRMTEDAPSRPPVGAGFPFAAPAGQAAKPARKPAALDRYERMLTAWISRFQVVPEEAARRRLHGSGVALFEIARSGEVLNVAIAKSSGHDVLDAAARDMVRAASPVVQVPSEYRPSEDVLSFAVPFRF